MRPQNSLSYKTQKPVLDAESASVTTSSRGGSFHAKDMGVDPLGERASPRMGNAHEVELKLNTRCSVEPCWEGLEIAEVICNGKGHPLSPMPHHSQTMFLECLSCCHRKRSREGRSYVWSIYGSGAVTLSLLCHFIFPRLGGVLSLSCSKGQGN